MSPPPFLSLCSLHNTAHGTRQYSGADHTAQHTQSAVNIEISDDSIGILH